MTQDTESPVGPEPQPAQGQVPGLDHWCREVLDALPFYALLVDDHNCILFANKATARDLHIPPEQLVGRFYPKAVHGIDGTLPGCSLEEAVEKNAAVEREVFDALNSRWLVSAVYPTGMTTPRGRRVYLHTTRDITPQRLAEARVQTLLRGLPDAVLYQTGGGIEYVSDNIEAVLGYQATEVGRDRTFFPKLIHVDDASRVHDSFKRWLRAGAEGVHEVEFRVRRRDGVHVWLLDRSRLAFRTPEGRCSTIGVMFDITERKRSEQALRESEERFRGVIENVSDLVLVLDASGTVRYASPSLQGILGLGGEEVTGRHLFDFAHPEDAPALIEAFAAANRKPGAPTTVECRFRHKDGSARVMECQLDNLYLRSEAAGIIVTARDVTERKRAEAELVRHRQHLEELVEERTRQLREAQDGLVARERLATLGQLAGSLAHELRNPLGAILNATYFLNMVLERDLKDKAGRHLAIISGEIERCNRIITSLLDYARGRPCNPAPASISEIVEDALGLARLPLEVKPEIVLPRDLPPVFVDDGQMTQVLANLFCNASQAMGGNGVVTVRVEPAGDVVRVSVADTGSGIKPEHLPHIFEPLFSTRTYGTGLGLAICRSFMEANRGLIEVSSVPGEGATFTISLPVAK